MEKSATSSFSPSTSFTSSFLLNNNILISIEFLILFILDKDNNQTITTNDSENEEFLKKKILKFFIENIYQIDYII